MPFRRIATVLVAGVVAVLATAAPAAAHDNGSDRSDDGGGSDRGDSNGNGSGDKGDKGDKGDEGDVPRPAATAAVSCGLVTLTFSNPTPWYYAFDYRIDEQPPTAADEWGETYTLVEVDGRADIHEKVVPVTFAEDSGTHTVSFRVARGAESDLYDANAWQSVQVDSNCQPDPVPTATFAADPSCTADAPGYVAGLVNPTAGAVTFTVETVLTGPSAGMDVTVSPGQTVEQLVRLDEDVPTTVRIRVGDTPLVEATLTVDCVASPTSAGDGPAADQGGPVALVDGNHQDPAATESSSGVRSLRTDDDKIKLISTGKLASTGPAGDLPVMATVGGVLVALGVVAVAAARRGPAGQR